MSTSLSILLPVHNAEQRLEASVAELLDVLPELTDEFDVLVIDDGSTDDTSEIASDLAMRFPQVGAIRHPVRLGLAEAIQTGLDHTAGEIVLVGDEKYGLEPNDLRALWQMREDQDLARNRRIDRGALDKTTWVARPISRRAVHVAHGQPTQRSAAIQMIRRRTDADLRLFSGRVGTNFGF